jgi:myo-inositol-1(or 4)-monophosphatase
LDAFWEFNLNPWDMAAGMLLVKEAGGRVSDMRGGLLSVRSPHVLANNGVVHDQILDLFQQIFQGKFRHSLPELDAGIP